MKETRDANALDERFNASNQDESANTQKLTNKAIAYACRLLGSREYSEKSLTSKLRLKGYANGVITETLQFLQDNNWLSDQRFCEAFVRGKIVKGQGMQRIKFELGQQGIAERLIDTALDAAEVDWQQLCTQMAAKKSASLGGISDLKIKLKVTRFLTYRGFSASEIRTALENKQVQVGERLSEHDEQ